MSQYKISKKRLAEIIKEEYESLLAQEIDEGYMDALDRSRDEEDRERRRQSRRIDQERERNRRRGGYRSPGAGSGMGGIGGGGKRPERFAGFNRDDDEAKPDYIDLDKDGDKKEPMKKAAKDKKMKKESMDSIRALIQKELKNL